jgi:hypothetical protein
MYVYGTLSTVVSIRNHNSNLSPHGPHPLDLDKGTRQMLAANEDLAFITPIRDPMLCQVFVVQRLLLCQTTYGYSIHAMHRAEYTGSAPLPPLADHLFPLQSTVGRRRKGLLLV